MEETPQAVLPVETSIPEKKNRGFFKPGNKFGNGRPPNNRAQIVAIRSRILRVVKRRIMHEKDLDTVSTGELLKFLASIMPKDQNLSPATQINYISNVPREGEAAPEAAPLVAEPITGTSATNSNLNITGEAKPDTLTPSIQEKKDEPGTASAASPIV